MIAPALACWLVLSPATDDVATGDAHFARGDFAEAAAAFARAYETEPDPATLYRWAQAERRAGNCPVAVQLYRRYLQTEGLDPANAEAARKNLARCGHVADDDDADADAERDDDTAVVAPPPTPTDEHPPAGRTWARDPVALGLLGAGAGLVVTSSILGVAAEGRRRRANMAAVEDDYVQHADRARSMTIAAGVLGGVGAALVIGGVVRYVISRGRATDRVAAGPGLGAVTIRF